MLKVSEISKTNGSLHEAGHEVPAQLPQAIKELKLKLHYMLKDFLRPTPENSEDPNLIVAIESWVQADQALEHLMAAIRQLNFHVDLGEPIQEPGRTRREPLANSSQPWELSEDEQDNDNETLWN